MPLPILQSLFMAFVGARLCMPLFIVTCELHRSVSHTSAKPFIPEAEFCTFQSHFELLLNALVLWTSSP